jgi:Uma2 family endonuclease
MFEIVSPGRESHDRDYVEKRADYYRIGVREYVIIDRFVRRVTVLTHSPGGYEERVLTPPDTYTSPLLPGLVIPLAEVLPS